MTVEVQGNARNTLSMVVQKLRSAGWDPMNWGIPTVRLDGEVIALILRPLTESPAARLRQPYTLETRYGGRLFGKAIRIEKGQLAIDTVRLRTQHFPLAAIRRLSKEVEGE